jgi:hypothetical protein
MDKFGIQVTYIKQYYQLLVKSSNTSCKYWTNVNCIHFFFTSILIDPNLLTNTFI